VRPAATETAAQPLADAATVEVAALEIHASTRPSVRQTVGHAFRGASAPLWSAVSTLNSRFRHFAAMARGARPTIVTGRAARLLPVDDSYAVLHATRPIGLDTPVEAWFDEDADAPLPEPAFSIRAGSFTVNTVVIPVEADDTVHRVLDRITASDAGVTARYDEETASVTLAAKSGSAPIALADDSSGFLSAVHLDDTAEAQTFPRMRSAFATAFSRMSEYADVNAGVVTLNGQPIVVDPATTTINGFIASVDGSPDVCAVLDQAASDITLSSLRSLTGIVSQDTVLFNDTVRNNIAYGAERRFSPEQIERAARAANAHEFIATLPHGYDTMIGEQGGALSEGERQRLTIARALLRRAPILIFDEPTAALDVTTEAALMDALDEVTRGRTSIVIAHRLRTVLRADRIVVLEQGELVEEGPPQELLRRGGAFARMHATQFGDAGAAH